MIDYLKKISAINWIKIAIIAVLLIGGIVYFSQKKTTDNKTATQNNNSQVTTDTSATKTTVSKPKPATAANVTTKCGLKITSPAINSSVDVPFVVKGVIDTLNVKGCVWNESNARAGEAEIFYNRNGEGWRSSGTSVPIITSNIPGSPTTTLAFEASFNLNRTALGLGSGTPVKIVFTELNIPPQPNPDNLYYLVYLK
jgi:hypothetical protein